MMRCYSWNIVFEPLDTCVNGRWAKMNSNNNNMTVDHVSSIDDQLEGMNDNCTKRFKSNKSTSDLSSLSLSLPDTLVIIISHSITKDYYNIPFLNINSVVIFFLPRIKSKKGYFDLIGECLYLPRASVRCNFTSSTPFFSSSSRLRFYFK